MLDMSRSMIFSGCFLAAKKVALALNALIRGQFPRDSLYIVGFSLYAREFSAAAAPAPGPERVELRHEHARTASCSPASSWPATRAATSRSS